MKVLAYSHRSEPAIGEESPFGRPYSPSTHLTVSVKLTGASVDIEAEIVTVPEVGPVV